MTPNPLLDEPVTIMFTDRVKQDKTAEYEAWSVGIHGEAKRFQGFMSVDVIRPNVYGDQEYTTLVKFDNCANMKRWRDSTSLVKWLEKLPDLVIGESYTQKSIGMELWFDQPKNLQPITEPSFVKRVVVGIICVYPLLLLLNWALGPVMIFFPGEAGLLLKVVILSGLLTYPVMPWMTRLLRHWLY